MRKNNNKSNVRTITTEYIEGDMLGQVIFWLSERKTDAYHAEETHRTYKKTRKLNIYPRDISEVYSERYRVPQTALAQK